MAAAAPFNPRPMLQNLIDKVVVVRLKWGEQEYKGRLVSADLYMNLQLSRTVEYQGDKKAPIGEVLIRCNNVLWIAEAATARPNDDDDMTG